MPDKTNLMKIGTNLYGQTSVMLIQAANRSHVNCRRFARSKRPVNETTLRIRFMICGEIELYQVDLKML